MNSFKKCLLFLSFIACSNVIYAEDLSDEIQAACGVRSCEIVFLKMKKFAKNGSPHAQAVLSLLYRGGFGTKVDKDLSVTYMKRAANGGLAYAQYNLAMLYRKGYLIEKNQQESERWLRRSAKAGYNKAVELLIKENKISQAEKIVYEQKSRKPIIEEGEEVLTISRERYTLSDLVDYLSSIGYGSGKQTGSRIKGRGCGNTPSVCVSWKVNSPTGRSEFITLMSKMNAFQTALEMSSGPR